MRGLLIFAFIVEMSSVTSYIVITCPFYS